MARFGLWCLHFPTEKSAISSFCRHYHHHLVKKRAMEVDKKSKILRRRRTFRESVRKRIRQEKPLQTYQISLRYLLNTYHHHRSRAIGQQVLKKEKKQLASTMVFLKRKRIQSWPLFLQNINTKFHQFLPILHIFFFICVKFQCWK